MLCKTTKNVELTTCGVFYILILSTELTGKLIVSLAALYATKIRKNKQIVSIAK